MPASEQVVRAFMIDWFTRFAELLSNEDYESLSHLLPERSMSAFEIQSVIQGYGRKVVPYPDAAFGLLDTNSIIDSLNDSWYAAMPVWTEEEGQSDLTIETIVAFEVSEAPIVTVKDLHAL